MGAEVRYLSVLRIWVKLSVLRWRVVSLIPIFGLVIVPLAHAVALPVMAIVLPVLVLVPIIELPVMLIRLVLLSLRPLVVIRRRLH
jgi:hypothetical protein